ncbi:MAG: phosphatase PAP2 family protein [Bacteroidia bacterium]
MNLRQLLYTERYFLLVYLLFWGVLCALLMVWGYEKSFLLLNSQHHPFADKIMPHLTHLGHGVLVGGLLLVIGRRSEIPVLAALIITLLSISLVIGMSKSLIFPDWFRPVKVFGAAQIHFISLIGEKNQSFPSGHSAVAAASFFFTDLAISRKRWWISTGLVIMSVLACYTRVYIGVHFPADILAGSFAGIAISVLVYLWIKGYYDSGGLRFLAPARRAALVFGALGMILLAIDLTVILTQNYL